jgi:beta-lactamase superfamily II metal-dependent hydrolase
VPDELVVNREHLNLWVFGPGFGEAIVVALPGEGWIVVDGAGPTPELPVLGFLEQHLGSERIELVLLTHPHEDHFHGLIKVLDRFGSQVGKMGCVAEYLSSAGVEHTWPAEIQAMAATVAPDDPEGQSRLGRAKGVLERFAEEWRNHSGRQFEARRGATLSLGRVTLEVLSPAQADVRSFFAASNLSRRIREEANDLSAVVELRFGQLRMLLGADLPVSRGGTTVSSGWTSVLTAYPNAGAVGGFKVAHHGSKEAVPTFTAKSGSRTWVVTPYNRGRSLPRFGPNEGMDLLLKSETPIHLTGMPVGVRQQQPMPACTPRASVSSSGPKLRPGLSLPGKLSAAGRPKGLDPSQCHWWFEFDAQGQLIGKRRGAAATEVV